MLIAQDIAGINSKTVTVLHPCRVSQIL